MLALPVMMVAPGDSNISKCQLIAYGSDRGSNTKKIHACLCLCCLWGCGRVGSFDGRNLGEPMMSASGHWN